MDGTALLEGASTLQSTPVGRLAMAAIATGIAQAALDHARSYADVREQFGHKLREFEGLQFKLADMAMQVEAARALLQKAAAEPSAALTAMAKVFASEAAMWVSTQAVQIFGGYGYMRDYPVEKLMRDAKATELMEGVNEIQRVTIARELYD
ncbi:MAG TPA: acyl-CoA dehydrogenase family protein [Longimicrobiales bacterium]